MLDFLQSLCHSLSMKLDIKKYFDWFKRTAYKAIGFFPTGLPQGMAAFEKWASRIIFTYQPAADDNSVRWALANMIMHLGHTDSHKPWRYFAKALHKAAANQIAAGVFNEIKEKQKQQQLEQQQKAASANGLQQ